MQAFVAEAKSSKTSGLIPSKLSTEKKKLGQRRHSSSKRHTSPVSVERASFDQTGLFRMSRNGP